MAERRLIAAIGLVATLAACGTHASDSATGAVPTGSAPVIRTDIVSRQQLPGTLTYAGSYTVINQSGPGIFTSLPAPGTVVSRGQTLYRLNTTAGQASVTEAQAALASALASLQSVATPVTTAQVAQLQHALSAAQQNYVDTVNSVGWQNQADASAVQTDQQRYADTVASVNAQNQADATTVRNDSQQLSADQSKYASDGCTGGSATPPCSTDQANIQRDQAQLASAVDRQHLDQLNGQAQVNQAAAQVAAAQQHLAIDQVGGQAHVNQAAAQVTAAHDNLSVQTQSRPSSIAAAQAQVATARAQVDAAEHRVDNRPIPLLFGDPAWRRLAVGVADGPDIQALQANLVALAFADSRTLRGDSHFDSATAAAVQRWQASLGVPQTGAVELGDVIFMPGPIRITDVHTLVGMTAASGQAVVEATSTQRAVLLQVDVSRAALINAGDQVNVTLADEKTTAAGTVTAIGTVATVPSGGNTGGNGSPPVAMVTVTITLVDSAAGGSLDQAPVNVAIAYDTHKGVLAVPVVALLAQPGGQYAVTVLDGSHRRNVTVTTGLFDDRGLVEVGSPELREGLSVEVPKP